MKIVYGTLAFLLLAAQVPAATITYITSLSGANESPTNTSPGTGSATVIIDTTANTMEVMVQFSGLAAGTTASHIHCCTTAAGTGTAAVATLVPSFAGFPLGVTSGTYDHTYDLTLASTYNPAFVTTTVAAAEAALLSGLATDKAYLNVHTTMFPGGEIRGFLVQTPEPATILLAGAALIGLSILRRR